MSFWSLLGLVSKKDFDVMSQQISEMTILMKSLIQQNKSMNNSITLVDNHVNNAFEKTIVKNNEALTTICESDIKNSSVIIEMMKNLSETSSNNLINRNQKLDDKLAFTNDSLKALIADTDIQTKNNIMNYENANQKLDDILTSIPENAENITSITRKEMQEQIIVIANAISMAISILDDQGKNNDEKLKSIESLSSKLLETVKIIWVDNMVDNLRKVTEPTKKSSASKIFIPI